MGLPSWIRCERRSERHALRSAQVRTQTVQKPAKAAGLAQFAAKHADSFGRIELIMIDGKATKTLDLTDESVRDKVKGIKLPEQLRALFESAA
jgi:hypothetical protein